jgi:hypothetical protein
MTVEEICELAHKTSSDKDPFFPIDETERIYIYWYGYKNGNHYNAFINSDNTETELFDFCYYKNIKYVYICGAGREINILGLCASTTSFFNIYNNMRYFTVYYIHDATYTYNLKNINELPEYIRNADVVNDIYNNDIENNKWIDKFIIGNNINPVSLSDLLLK